MMFYSVPVSLGSDSFESLLLSSDDSVDMLRLGLKSVRFLNLCLVEVNIVCYFKVPR